MRRLFIALALFATGCFDIEQSIDLNKDMSGTAKVRMGVDFEPMVNIMAYVGHGMVDGKTTPVTKEELDKVKADFKKQGWSKKGAPQATKEEIQKKLPPGITLLDSAVDERDLGVVSTFRFSFDHLSRLNKLVFPSDDKKKESEGDASSKNTMMEQPFQNLEVVESGNTVTIRTMPQNPTQSVKDQATQQSPAMSPEMEKMMRDAFKKVRIAYRITAPFTVVSSNATSREGNTLIWVYDFDRLEKMSKSGAKLDDYAVKVTYRK
jgi:hypothetical protein